MQPSGHVGHVWVRGPRNWFPAQTIRVGVGSLGKVKEEREVVKEVRHLDRVRSNGGFRNTVWTNEKQGRGSLGHVSDIAGVPQSGNL